jgi:hypothetical protein
MARFSPMKDAPVQCLGKQQGVAYRPADILLAGDDYTQDCVDVCVVSPLSLRMASDVVIGQKVEEAERAKYQKHEEACHNAAYGFKAFAVDVFGIVAKKSFKFLNRIRNAMARATGRPRWLATAICYRRISMSIQLGVTRQIVAQLAESESSENVYNI